MSDIKAPLTAMTSPLQDLESRYHRLQARYQQVREGRAIWRHYNRTTHQFETYAEALEEIEEKIQEMQQILAASPTQLVLRMELAEPPDQDSGRPGDAGGRDP